MGTPCQCRVALMLVIATLIVDAFDKPFIPTNSTPYNPGKSSTFKRTKGRFALSYADQTRLNGYVGEDIVQVRAQLCASVAPGHSKCIARERETVCNRSWAHSTPSPSLVA